MHGNYKYGAPLLTRTSDISEKVKSSTTYYPLEVMGKYQGIKQIRVRIEDPVYRIANGRTKTFQKEYLATHPDAPADLFTKDPESIEAQTAQHEILGKLVKDEDLLKEFQDGTQQTEPIIVTPTGVVVNGNRRLCAWRTLYNANPEKYKYFEFVELAVLPSDCDESEVKALEKRLQIQKTHRAEYKWHNKASMMKEERESGTPVKDIAKSYDVTKKEVDVLIGAFEYADIYLQNIGKKDQWSLVDDYEFAFKAMVEERKKFLDQGRKELFEAVCFKLIENKDYQGRLYSSIPDIANNLDAIAQALQEDGVLPKPESEKPTEKDQDEHGDMSSDSQNGDPVALDDEPSTEKVQEPDDDIDLLSGDDTEKDDFSDLATAVNTSPVKIGGLVKRITDEQKAIKEEEKSAKYLINTLAKISKFLWNVRNNSLNEATVIDGVPAQLEEIKESIRVIEDWLDDRQ